MTAEPRPNSFRTGPDEGGRFGPYGGRFVPETLMPLVLDLEQAYRQAKADPAFRAELEAIVGLDTAPPRHAVVRSVDEEPQIQALDRTQPGLPIKPGRCETMTHDYERNGTTTLFAALNVLDGTVLGRCMQRHRHQEFLRFLNAVEAAAPAGKPVHAILDN